MVAASAGRLPPSGGETEHPECRNPDRMTVVKESMLNWMVIERSISQETPYFASHGQDPDGPEAPPWQSGSQPAPKDPPAGDDT